MSHVALRPKMMVNLLSNKDFSELDQKKIHSIKIQPLLPCMMMVTSTLTKPGHLTGNSQEAQLKNLRLLKLQNLKLQLVQLLLLKDIKIIGILSIKIQPHLQCMMMVMFILTKAKKEHLTSLLKNQSQRTKLEMLLLFKDIDIVKIT